MCASSTSSISGLPHTSLIICSRNRPKLLSDSVDSIFAGVMLPDELIVVDQSDRINDHLACRKGVSQCQFHYIWTQTKGLSRARNIGISKAACEIVVFTDDDVLVDPTWFAELIWALVQAGPRAVVTGRIIPAKPEKPGGFVETIATSEDPKRYRGRICSDVLTGAQMAMYRSAIAEVGNFDERLGVGGQFQAADDNDYGFRLLEAGYQIVYAPQAIIYHRAWRNKPDYFPLRWNYGRGKGGFYLKYASFKDPYMLRRMIWEILLNWIRFPWRVLHRPRLAAGDLVYSLGIISGALEWAWTGQGSEPLVNP